MSSTKNNKVVIIGVDGATFDLVNPWIKEGKLPNLSKLIKDGASGNLSSTIPYNSAPAWSSFITGKNPGNHGVFDFRYLTRNSYDLKFINSYCRTGKSMWKVLGDEDKKVVVFNVPITYPPEEVNGSLISGLTAPEVNEKIFYPRELFKEIVSNVGTYKIKPFPRDQIRLNRFDRVFEEMVAVVDKHYEVADYLFREKDWDFFCMVFGTTDRVQHYFWQHMDPTHPFHDPAQSALYGECIYKIYEQIDEKIGSWLERLDDNTSVIVLSDHGAGANGNRVFYLNNWLAHEGLLSYKGSSNTKTLKTGVLKKGIFLAKKYIPRKYKNKLRGAFPKLKSKVETIYWDSRIDWSKTKVFSYDNNGLVWINTKGRESEGVVNEGQEYEDVRNEVIERALNFTDPETGEKIFSEAYRREDLYYGDTVDQAPDIVLVQKERPFMYAYRNSGLSKQRLPIETITLEETRNNPVHPACHRMDGIVVLKGSPVQGGKKVTGAKIIDIAPTILYLMGVPVPKDMDGKVITEAIDPAYLETNPISYAEVDKSENPERQQTDYTESEEKKVEETLRSLGYID